MIESNVSQEVFDAMVVDLVNRGRLRHTPEQVKDVMARCHTLAVDGGIMTLDFHLDECHVIYMYIRPGANLLPLFESIAEDVARHKGCRVIRFISRRKPESIMRTRPAYRPNAILYEKELDY
jgi:hypothetical protein